MELLKQLSLLTIKFEEAGYTEEGQKLGLLSVEFSKKYCGLLQGTLDKIKKINVSERAS